MTWALHAAWTACAILGVSSITLVVLFAVWLAWDDAARRRAERRKRAVSGRRLLAKGFPWPRRRSQAPAPAPSASERLTGIERHARRQIGMPANHPERITALLDTATEDRLTAVAIELWPRDEYALILPFYLGDPQ